MNSKNNIIKVVCIFAGLCLTTVGIARAQEEMVDTQAEEMESVQEYVSNEAASTNLGSLLANLKLD